MCFWTLWSVWTAGAQVWEGTLNPSLGAPLVSMVLNVSSRSICLLKCSHEKFLFMELYMYCSCLYTILACNSKCMGRIQWGNTRRIMSKVVNNLCGIANTEILTAANIELCMAWGESQVANAARGKVEPWYKHFILSWDSPIARAVYFSQKK